MNIEAFIAAILLDENSQICFHEFMLTKPTTITCVHASILKEEDVTLFLHGACHIFALALHEHFDYTLFLLQDLTSEHPKNAAHVYCRFNDTHLVDVVGIASEKTALTELGWIGTKYQKMEISPEKLERYFTIHEGGGLYAAPEFLAVTRERARARIATYIDYYSGRKIGDIPGASRMSPATPEEIQRILCSV